MSFSVGQELAPQTFFINREKLVSYANASGDQNPIHQDEEFAKSVGLENVIAHGMFTMALTGRYVSDVARGSEKVKSFSARFTKPVIVPADVDVEIVVSAKVAAVEGNIVKLDVTTSCQDVKVLGMAKASFEV
jgi:acyl dehydratase